MGAETIDGIGPFKRLSLPLGVLAFLCVYFMPTPAFMSAEGKGTLAVAALMLFWWLGEAIPLGITGLLPIVLFPLLGIADLGATTALYGHDIIFLFLGGFMIGAAMQKWRLHERVALFVLSKIGSRATCVAGGFMIATGFISMWMSNTATTLMMLPIAGSVLQLLETPPEAERRFSAGLLLAVAFAANVGGTATLIGTPPNAALAAFLSKELGYQITFLRWFMFAAPFAAVLMALVWFVLTRVFGMHKIGEMKGAEEMIRRKYSALGDMSAEEYKVTAVFCCAAALWLGKGAIAEALPFVASLEDAAIAIAASVALFLIPANGGADEGRRIMVAKDLKRIPWGILLLFGGGLNLAGAMSGNGVTEMIGGHIAGLGAWGYLPVVASVVFVVLMMTECIGNMALIAAMLPVLAPVASGFGESPVALAAGATLACSCAFMLPMGTPPNAIVFADGSIHISDMAPVGFVLNVIAALLIVPLTLYWATIIF